MRGAVRGGLRRERRYGAPREVSCAIRGRFLANACALANASALAVACAALALAGCVVNPVTGEREVGWVSTASQIAIGTKQFAPAQQMEGGVYRVDPAVATYVARVGARVARQSPVDLPFEFVVLNQSVPNAWALPGGKIAINRGLLVELDSEAELASVLGHEVVHAAARHGAQSIERGMLLQGAILAAAIGTADQTYAGAVLGSAQLAAGLLNQKYGRDAERESDYYGTRFMAEAGYDPQASVRLQETFVRLAGDRAEQSWLQGLFASHPPSTERVAGNKRTVAALRGEGFQGGETGRDQHRQAIATLLRDADAYANYDEARARLAKDDLEGALQQLERALAAQPAEAQFHALRGRIRLEQKRYGDAVTNYDRALEREDGYFALHLGRGIARARLGQAEGARADLTRSLDLLPTASAHQELGKLAETRGDIGAAIAHYELAVEGGGGSARTALAELVRLDMPRRPERYVATALGRDERGRVLLSVANRAGVDLADVAFEVRLGFASGVLTVRPRLAALPAGSSAVIIASERVEPVDGGEVKVISATVRARAAGAR